MRFMMFESQWRTLFQPDVQLLDNFGFSLPPDFDQFIRPCKKEGMPEVEPLKFVRS
jgi:hypothetical protein